MLQNTYSLPDLIDLSLTVPEPGAVNFNILHTVLHAIVKELQISDVRPWCHIEEDSLLAKTVETKAKLREASVRRREVLPDKPSHHIPELEHDESKKDIAKETTEKPDKKLSLEEKATNTLPERRDSSVQTEDITPVKTEQLSHELDKHTVVIDERPEDGGKTQALPETAKEPSTKDSDKAEEVFEKPVEPTHAPEESPGPSFREPAGKTGKGRHLAENAIKYTNLNMRVGATEEGLHRLSNIVDIIADKIRKAELRKKAGGPSSEELEAIDERLLEVEEALAQYAKDHELLMKINETLENMLREFERIKALAALLEQMQIDISKKADKEETWAALALKGDLELVLTKVDQVEFETAIEELGEAIGLLGIKFTKKNEEWEERAAEMWKAIDGKMTLDVFEAARIKIESRLTAILYGLQRLKKVVEDLLYPESSGVTRCILCRRPACISGLDCLSASESYNPFSSDRSSGDGDESDREPGKLSQVPKLPKINGSNSPPKKEIYLSPSFPKERKILSAPQLFLGPVRDSDTQQTRFLTHP